MKVASAPHPTSSCLYFVWLWRWICSHRNIPILTVNFGAISLVVGEHRAGCVPSRVISPSTNVLVGSRAMFFIVPLSAVRACFFTSTCASCFGRLAFFHCPFRPGRLKLMHSRSESQHRSNRAESTPCAKRCVIRWPVGRVVCMRFSTPPHRDDDADFFTRQQRQKWSATWPDILVTAFRVLNRDSNDQLCNLLNR
jgi:hypothetical protein